MIGGDNMRTIAEIKLENPEYKKKCASHAIAFLYLIDMEDLNIISDFFDLTRNEILKQLVLLGREMQNAIHLSSSVALNTFVYEIFNHQNQDMAYLDNNIFSEVQCMLNESNYKVQELKSTLSTQYGEEFEKLEFQSEKPNEFILYQQEKNVYSTLANTFSQLEKDKTVSKEQLKSLGITFIDKYEFVLQNMIDRSRLLKEFLTSINFLSDVTSIVSFIWIQYCECNKKTLASMLSYSYSDIEKEVFHLLQ